MREPALVGEHDAFALPGLQRIETCRQRLRRMPPECGKRILGLFLGGNLVDIRIRPGNEA